MSCAFLPTVFVSSKDITINSVFWAQVRAWLLAMMVRFFQIMVCCASFSYVTGGSITIWKLRDDVGIVAPVTSNFGDEDDIPATIKEIWSAQHELRCDVSDVLNIWRIEFIREFNVLLLSIMFIY